MVFISPDHEGPRPFLGGGYVRRGVGWFAIRICFKRRTCLHEQYWIGHFGWFKTITLPETNIAPDGWKITFLLGNPIFKCYISFRNGSIPLATVLFFSRLLTSNKFFMCRMAIRRFVSLKSIQEWWVTMQSTHLIDPFWRLCTQFDQFVVCVFRFPCWS